jgi:hypothetical protein
VEKPISSAIHAGKTPLHYPMKVLKSASKTPKSEEVENSRIVVNCDSKTAKSNPKK